MCWRGDSREVQHGTAQEPGEKSIHRCLEGDQKRGGVIKVAAHDEKELCFLSWASVHASPSRRMLASNRSIALWSDVLILHL